MTQSGQGEEPSARPAREGIVLPSDGGAPLLPGMTGDQVGPVPTPAPAPAGGQAWGQPWGPEQQSAPPQPPAQDWGTPAADAGQPWGSPEPPQAMPSAQEWGAQEAQPSRGATTADPRSGWGGAADPGFSWQQPDGSGFPGHQPSDAGYPAQQQPQGSGFPGRQPQGGAGTGAGPLPPEGAPTGSYDGGGQAASYNGGEQAGSYDGGAHAGSHGGGGLPVPRVPQGAHSAPMPPVAAAPLPPVDEGATQYIPHIPPLSAGAADEGATQYLPPVAAAPDEGATQYIPPVGPGALPPELPADDATRFLGQAGAMPAAADSDAQATQYIPPVPAQPGAAYGIRPGGPEDRQTPAEFDNLFRSEHGDPAGASATQQMPRFEPRGGPGAHGAPPAPGGRAAARRAGADDGAGGGRGGRGRSRVPLITAVGVGIVVLGIGAGALLSGGGGDSEDDNSKTVSATAPATEGSASADPAKVQAVALDKLLADSGTSRNSVVRAVANIKACNNLGQAATDLRNAAKQRTGLVTRLSGLAVDKLPNNAELKTALTSAWQASASADSHYAAWADQAAGKKGCPKGQARTTGQTQAGNRASGTASVQKVKAAKLWNTIASTYGLTQRQPTQL